MKTTYDLGETHWQAAAVNGDLPLVRISTRTENVVVNAALTLEDARSMRDSLGRAIRVVEDRERVRA